jgi:hypothetical protein
MLISSTIFYQHFLNVATFYKMLGNIFLFLNFFQQFSEFKKMLVSSFCEVLQTFFKNVGKITFFGGGRTRAPVSSGRRAPGAGSPRR